MSKIISPPGERYGSPKRSPPFASFYRMNVRDRLRSILDERRWQAYARSPVDIFYRVQP